MADPLKGYEQIDTVFLCKEDIDVFNANIGSFIDALYCGRRIKDIKVLPCRDHSDLIKAEIYAKFYEENEMNTEEQIKQEIKDAQKALERAQKKLAELENSKKYGWWKPEEDQNYYYIDSEGETWSENNAKSGIDTQRLDSFNCFRTIEEAGLEQLQIVIRRKIQDIALRLNKGRKIDWNDYSQEKYKSCIYYDPQVEVLSVPTVLCNKQDFYHPICLDENFGKVIYNELKDDLKRYFELQRKLA